MQLIQFQCSSRSVSTPDRPFISTYSQYCCSQMLSTSDLYFIAVYTAHSLSLDVLCLDFAKNLQLTLNYLYLWSGAPVISVISFVAENKATWILCKIHRGWTEKMRMYPVHEDIWTITRIVRSHLFISRQALWRRKLTGSP